MMDENDQQDDANVEVLSKPNRIRSNSSISNANSTADSRSSIPEDKLVESLYQSLMKSLCQDVASNLHQLVKMDDAIPSSWKLCSGTAAPTRRDLYPELYNGNGNDGTGRSPTKKRKTDSEIQDVLTKYAVDLPKTDSPLQGNKRRNVAEEEEKLILLSKIQKEKESNYKDSDDEDETGDDNTKDDEDDDDEDFKMEDDDVDDDNDDGDDDNSKTKTKRSLSTTSETLSKDETTTTTTAKPSSSVLDIWGKNPSKEPKNRLCRCQLCGRLISTSRFASHLDKCMGLSTSRGTTPTPPLLGAHTKKRNGGSR